MIIFTIATFASGDQFLQVFQQQSTISFFHNIVFNQTDLLQLDKVACRDNFTFALSRALLSKDETVVQKAVEIVGDIEVSDTRIASYMLLRANEKLASHQLRASLMHHVFFATGDAKFCYLFMRNTDDIVFLHALELIGTYGSFLDLQSLYFTRECEAKLERRTSIDATIRRIEMRLPLDPSERSQNQSLAVAEATFYGKAIFPGYRFIRHRYQITRLLGNQRADGIIGLDIIVDRPASVSSRNISLLVIIDVNSKRHLLIDPHTLALFQR
jgi:hypothetical protein